MVLRLDSKITHLPIILGNHQAEREDVVTDQRYLVRYTAYRNNSQITDKGHIHYYPAGEDDLVFDIHSPGELTRR